jgi:hypothetical protein
MDAEPMEGTLNDMIHPAPVDCGESFSNLVAKKIKSIFKMLKLPNLSLIYKDPKMR